jgi:outer membrane receptor protein involved in Fe transport
MTTPEDRPSSARRPMARRPHIRTPLTLAMLALAAQGHAWAHEGPDTGQQRLDRVEIVGTTPLPGSGVPRDQVPSNVQGLGTSRLAEIGARSLPDLLGSSLGSVHVTETQGNPYQMEVSFRGYTASPLLGQPQGLSVFLDGVRINEGFGDIVNWDLVPRNALASLTLVPGSNPVFGLNTLGGALALATRSGDTHPGTEAEATLGSSGRRDLELSHGRKIGEDTYLFVATDLFNEDGWRDESPSRVRQVFIKLNGEDGPLDWSLSFNGADNRLIGNGLLPESMLTFSRSQIYTRPDETSNRLGALSLRVGQDLGEGLRVEALAYHRRLDARTVNGDLNDAYDPGNADPLQVVAESGVENRTRSRQRSDGLALQWNLQEDARLVNVGVSLDRSRTRFAQTEAEGFLDATRAVDVTEPEETNASLSGRSRTGSLYASLSERLAQGLTLSASGRYNHTRVTTVDVGRAELGLGTQLDSDHTFTSFNPALGATWALDPSTTAYGGVSQGSRAPSPIELGCSDPLNPCVLPNALQADPPLKQVVARTIEAGLRGRLDSGWRWNVGVFSSGNRDDILFISNGQAAGYFANVGKTRRQGLEAGLQGRSGPIDLALSYTRLAASYRTGHCQVAQANSSAETSAACTGDDEIEVRPGDRLPGVPANLLKLDLGWRPMAGLRLSAQVQAQSGATLRGNDNGQHQPDGVDFLGQGRVPGFAVLNLQAQWKLGSGWALVGKVNNALDRRYASGGALAENAFDASGTLQDPADWRSESFLAPGAPRSVSVALQWQFKD